MNGIETLLKFYRPEADSNRADWVVERCKESKKDTLHTVVPSGFESHVRICHTAYYVDALDPNDHEGWNTLREGYLSPNQKRTPIRWDEVARRNGQTPHRLMRWGDVFPHTEFKSGDSFIVPPHEDVLSRAVAESLFEVLIDQTGPDQECICGFWEGYGGFDQNLELPSLYFATQNYRYFLFNARLASVRDHYLAVEGTHYCLTPNTIWPTTNDWYLTIPFQTTSSYFGGSSEIVAAIESSNDLETYEAFPSDNIG